MGASNSKKQEINTPSAITEFFTPPSTDSPPFQTPLTPGEYDVNELEKKLESTTIESAKIDIDEKTKTAIKKAMEALKKVTPPPQIGDKKFFVF